MQARLAVAVLILCHAGFFPGFAAAQSPHTHQHSFSDAEKWAHVLAEMQAAGHALAAEHRFLPHQYFLVFRPAS